MDGNYNGYLNSAITPATTSVWVGSGANLMEPLVDQFGNLRFDNKLIPLTTPVDSFIRQAPSLPNLTPPPLSLSSPVMGAPPGGPFYVVSVQESPSATVTADPISAMTSRVPNMNYTTVGIVQNGIGENGSVMSVGQPPQLVANGSYHGRQRYVSNPEIQPVSQPLQRRVSAPEPNQSPFRGQPYMRQLSIDHSNGEVIRHVEQEVPQKVSAQFVLHTPPLSEANNRPNSGRLVYVSNINVNDGTDSASSMSSSSVSPYNSVPSSPRPDPQGSSAAPVTPEVRTVYDPVPPRYIKPSDKSRCLMCDKTVYAMEKRGPIKDVLFHKLCFKCVVCNMTLDLKNFCQNDDDLADLNVYCKSHKPCKASGKLDAGALSINRALHAPRLSQVNEQIRGGPEAMRGGTLDTEALNIKSALNVPKQSLSTGENVRQTGHSYSIDNDVVSVVHARNVPVTELQVSNKRREQVWSREKRRAEGIPPPDVIRHDTEVEGYGGEPYRHDPPPERSYR